MVLPTRRQAPLGQASAHFPHPVHRARSSCGMLFSAGKSDSAKRTSPSAGSAAQALVLEEHELRLRGKALGVMAPPAAQGTTLKKNRGADSRAIVDGKTLDVENPSRKGQPSPPALLGSRNNFFLESPGEVHEIVAIPGDPHHKVLEILGSFLRLPKELGAHHVELHVVPTQVEEDPDELSQLLYTLFAC